MSAIASHMNIAGGTRYAFASAASLTLSQSGFMSKIIVERLSTKLPQAVFVLQFFGVQQKCALAARHLKAVDSDYYWILYQAKLEMLYYFVEPAISKMISRAKSQLFSNLDDLADFLQGDFSV
jgi:hypothetical protein